MPPSSPSQDAAIENITSGFSSESIPPRTWQAILAAALSGKRFRQGSFCPRRATQVQRFPATMSSESDERIQATLSR
jgi:hypothetical protein